MSLLITASLMSLVDVFQLVLDVLGRTRYNTITVKITSTIDIDCQTSCLAEMGEVSVKKWCAYYSRIWVHTKGKTSSTWSSLCIAVWWYLALIKEQNLILCKNRVFPFVLTLPLTTNDSRPSLRVHKMRQQNSISRLGGVRLRYCWPSSVVGVRFSKSWPDCFYIRADSAWSILKRGRN